MDAIFLYQFEAECIPTSKLQRRGSYVSNVKDTGRRLGEAAGSQFFLSFRKRCTTVLSASHYQHGHVLSCSVISTETSCRHRLGAQVRQPFAAPTV